MFLVWSSFGVPVLPLGSRVWMNFCLYTFWTRCAYVPLCGAEAVPGLFVHCDGGSELFFSSSPLS